MKLEDKYLLKWFLICRKIADELLKFLAILRGGQDLFQGGLPPLGYATAFDNKKKNHQTFLHVFKEINLGFNLSWSWIVKHKDLWSGVSETALTYCVFQNNV